MMAFARAMGYEYTLQFDDDLLINEPIAYNLLERAEKENIKMAVMENSKSVEFKYYVMSLPELSKNWIVQNNFSTVGNLLQTVNAATAVNKLEQLSTATWNREIYQGYFTMLSVPFWFSADVQDYLDEVVFRRGFDISYRWQEQAVMNMIRLIFIPQEEVLRISDVVYMHNRKENVFAEFCHAPNKKRE
jgi:hypothetical protein